MDILRVLSKLIGVEQKVAWSRAKKLRVIGPAFWGAYHAFVDSEFNVALFLGKADGSTHVILGNIVEGRKWLKFDETGKLVINNDVPRGGFEWKINPDKVLFRGSGMPPGHTIYEGKVVLDEPFEDQIDDAWVTSQIQARLSRTSE